MSTDYFVVTRAGSDRFPLQEWDEDGGPFYRSEPVAVTEPIKLRLGPPVPPDPVIVDYTTACRVRLSPRGCATCWRP